jgi:hydroxyacylglutathione hydrolase
MILEICPSGPVETNAILLGCSQTRKAALIDAPPGSSEFFLSLQKRENLSIEMILLTHSHWDHIAELSLLRRDLDAPIFVHREDAKNVESPGSDGLLSFIFVEGVKPDHYLSDHQHLSLGHLDIEVIHTPGHTPGGVCFYLKKEGLLISGDTLFKGAIGNLNFPTSSPVLMCETLAKLIALPPETRVIPGHGKETTIEREKRMMHLVMTQLQEKNNG